MKQANMSPNDLFVCYYGTKNHDLIYQLNNAWNENFGIQIFNYSIDTSTPDLFFNLWKCAVTKADIELTTKKFFRTVVAINLDDENVLNMFTEKTQSHLLINPKKLLQVERNTVYYCMGALVAYHKTALNPSIFYAESSTFDIACNYGVVRNSIIQDANIAYSIGPMKDSKNEVMNDHVFFYNFLKSHKLKTECINYENRGMFKRTA